MRESSLELALRYVQASVRMGRDSLEISPALAEDEQKIVYAKLVDLIESPERVFDFLLRFEDQRAYFQICEDSAIADYFAQFKIPIASKRDIDLFSQVLADRARDLANSDTRLELELEKRGYQRQLQEMPVALSRLKQTIARFDDLEKPFSAIVRYIWETVVLHDFRMQEIGNNALARYDGRILLEPFGAKKVVHVEYFRDDKDRLEFFIKPTFKLKREEVIIKRFFFPDTKDYILRESDEVQSFEIVPLRSFDYDSSNCKGRHLKFVFPHDLKIDVEHYLHGGDAGHACRLTLSEFIDDLKTTAIASPDQYIPSLKAYLWTLFNLPRLITNYSQRTNESLKTVLTSIAMGDDTKTENGEQ